MLLWFVMFILTVTLDISRGHLCIQEPRQRLNVTGYNDYYSDCYYYHGPCGNTFDRAPPYMNTVKSGSEVSVKLYTPVIHYTKGKKGYFQFNLRAVNSDNFVEIAKVPDADGLYHEVSVNFPYIKGDYILQVVHSPYQYVPFYSCSDLTFVADDSLISNDSYTQKDISTSEIPDIATSALYVEDPRTPSLYGNQDGTTPQIVYSKGQGDQYEAIPKIPRPKNQGDHYEATPRIAYPNVQGEQSEADPKILHKKNQDDHYEDTRQFQSTSGLGDQYEDTRQIPYPKNQGDQYEDTRQITYPKGQGDQYEDSRQIPYPKNQGDQYEDTRQIPYPKGQGDQYEDTRQIPYPKGQGDQYEDTRQIPYPKGQRDNDGATSQTPCTIFSIFITCMATIKLSL